MPVGINADLSDRLIGTQSWFEIDGINIPITKIEPSVKKSHQDITSSVWYSSDQGLVSPAWLDTAIKVDLQIKGQFRFSVVPTPILANMFSDSAEVFVSIGLNFLALMGQGYFRITDLDLSIPIDDVVDYECSLISHGPFVPRRF